MKGNQKENRRYKMNQEVTISISHLMPQTLAEKLKMADVFVKSGLMPSGFRTASQVLVALQMGHELGIPPMRAIQNIAIVNGRPTLSADLLLAIAMRTGEVENFDDNDCNTEKAVIKLKRRGYSEKISVFTWEDARKAGLTGKENWQRFPQRMLRARALAFAVRDRFPDVLAGLYTADEISGGLVEDVIDVEILETKEKFPSPQEQEIKPVDSNSESMTPEQKKDIILISSLLKSMGITSKEACLEKIRSIIPRENGSPIQSRKDLTSEERKSVIDFLKKEEAELFKILITALIQDFQTAKIKSEFMMDKIIDYIGHNVYDLKELSLQEIKEIREKLQTEYSTFFPLTPKEWKKIHPPKRKETSENPHN
jgi:hypothetical protein